MIRIYFPLAAVVVSFAVLHTTVRLVTAESRRTGLCITDPMTVVVAADSVYPAELKRRDISGRLRLFLHADGSVDHIAFERHFGYPTLDKAAVDAFGKWKFRPDRKCDIITVPITFTLKKH